MTDEALQGLHSLKLLDIVGCGRINLSAGFQYITCLEQLGIGSCSELEGLAEALQHMTALRLLTLSDIPNLESLPDCLGNLSLLHELGIYVCPKLTCLPTSIQRLSGLTRLTICGCPELEKRCQKEIGEDWPKIAHVQYIHIENANVTYGGHGCRNSEGTVGFLWASM